MRIPSAAEVLRIWELGSAKRGWYRALLLLAPLFPETTFGSLAELTIGSRNALLLRLRERLFGHALTAIVTCAHCSTKTELSLSTETFLRDAPAEPRFAADHIAGAETEDGLVRYRLLNSRDLRAAGTRTAAEAARFLVDRAVIERDVELANSSRELIADGIVSSDPLSDIQLGVKCPECGVSDVVPFDVVAYLWSEIEAEAGRLLDQVHRIAAVYGWSEAAVLSMSHTRRREYLRRAL